MSPTTEQEYKIKIEELQKEIEVLKKKQTEKIKFERYGLNWIDVPEAFEKESENKIPVLKEVKDKAIKNDDGKPTHILIEGDNYHALKCLNYTHAGKIDVIYIDPPYNTGNKENPFVYNDSRFLTEYPDGKPILLGDPIRHSSWLSFMSKRLKLAKNLLKENGVIFISIDDNEQANLKLLCDQIFGEENFISDIIWNSRKSVSNDAVVSLNHNYTLVYTKNVNSFYKCKSKFKLSDNGEGFANPDNDPRGLWKADPFDSPGIRPNLTYEIKNPNTGEVFLPPQGRCWRTGEKEYKIFLNENRIVFGKTGKSKPQLKRFLSEAQEKGLTPKSIWDDCGTATNGTQEIQEIFGEKIFDTPKPTDLIKRIIQLSTGNSQFPKILDFFAGSGTTLHATMKLNAEDGGNRQCILVQQKETPSNICESITYERNRRVMNGYTNAKGEEISGLGNSLKYYKTDFIGEHSEKLASDEDKILLAQKAGCLISLSENTLEEIKTTEYYQLYTDGKKLTAIYFNEDPEMFPDFVEDIAEVSMNSTATHKTTVYVYCEGNPEIYENEFDDLTDIEIKAIPQPILQIYKTVNETH